MLQEVGNVFNHMWDFFLPPIYSLTHSNLIGCLGVFLFRSKCPEDMGFPTGVGLIIDRLCNAPTSKVPHFLQCVSSHLQEMGMTIVFNAL